MKRSILMSLLVIGAVTALVGVGSWATFSDTETSDDNVVSTGSLNLQVGTTTGGIGACDYTDPWSGPLFSLTNAAPGDSDEVTICLWNDSSLDGEMTATVSAATDVEVGACNEPEEAAEGSADCADGDAGELAAETNVTIWADGDCDNIQDTGEPVFFGDTADALPTTIGPVSYGAGDAGCVGVKAEVDAGAGNEVQTDEISVDVTIDLVQA